MDSFLVLQLLMLPLAISTSASKPVLTKRVLCNHLVYENKGTDMKLQVRYSMINDHRRSPEATALKPPPFGNRAIPNGV